ncbi:alpha/beta hydrolase family protein [Lysinibacillus sp. NPDC097231]|uniref:alpha/beta hydrolase family protein n=1 Tax=Lysinibacillus sp. NPDC097231 TaxID=3364142 RepID=UPI00380A71DE
MRLFEGILIAVHIFWLFSFLFRFNAKIKIITNVIALILLVIHLDLEGYRWQMGLTYMLFSLLTVFTMKPFIQRNAEKGTLESVKNKRKVKKLSYISFIVTYSFSSFGLVIVMPVFQLPKPTGPFEVGMNSRYLIDESRHDLEQKDRELMIQIWYPAEVKDDTKDIHYESFPYEEWSGTMEFIFSVPRSVFEYLKYGQTNSIKDIAVSKQEVNFPVLLFSHGFGSTRLQNFSQMEELASYGYVVVSVDHTNDAAYTKFPDGREIMNQTDAYSYSFNIEDEKDVKMRSKDMSYVLDHLTTINDQDPHGLFTGKMDMGRIGIFGHSYGGSTAAQALLDDSRISAGINIDGPLHEPVASSGFEQPFMFILDEDYLYISDEEIQYTNITREEFQKYHDKITELADFHYKEGIKGDTFMLTFIAGDHYTFTDFPFLSPLLSWNIDINQFHQVMNWYILAFFDHYVKGEEPNPLLKKEKMEDKFYYYKTNIKND